MSFKKKEPMGTGKKILWGFMGFVGLVVIALVAVILRMHHQYEKYEPAHQIAIAESGREAEALKKLQPRDLFMFTYGPAGDLKSDCRRFGRFERKSDSQIQMEATYLGKPMPTLLIGSSSTRFVKGCNQEEEKATLRAELEQEAKKGSRVAQK